MDGQRTYPLVVWSPPSIPFLVKSAARSTSGSEAALSPEVTDTGCGSEKTALSSSPACGCHAVEWLELRLKAGQWKSLFQRCKQREEHLRRRLAEALHWQTLYEQAHQHEQILQQQITELQARLRVLEQRLHGRKTERKKRHPEAQLGDPSAPKRQRGQQPTNPPPPRRNFDHLPTTEENRALSPDAARCPQCGKPFAPFPGTDDGDILEIEVRGYRRRYHRQRYGKTCTCAATPAVITAPPPPKLIPKGYLGISVWVLLLLEKYACYQPTYRFLALLRSFGIDLPLGTVTDGMEKLVPLFEPVYEALAEHQRQEHRWHCDETRWQVFIDWEGKTGHHWYLWVFCSPEAVVFVLDPTHAHPVPQRHFGEASGIASVDRAATYKSMAQVKTGQIILAFCWAHVRRDFLIVLTGYGALGPWVGSWLEEIGELYQRNDARLEALAKSSAAGHDSGAPPRLPPPDRQAAAVPSPPVAPLTAEERHLREHVAHLVQRRDTELQQPDLHPACRHVLTSMQNHWSGLTVFLDHPEVPLDNNTAERAERGPVVARKNYYGSGALWSGRLAAMLFSIFHTLAAWKLCPLRWLTAYLTACAEADAKPPANVAAFLPWNMTLEQKQQYALPSSIPHPPPADTS